MPVGDAMTETITLRVTPEEKRMYDLLGGRKWLRELIAQKIAS